MPKENMEIPELPSNSLNAQSQRQTDDAPKKIVRQITTGKRVTKSAIVTTLNSVGSYILFEILIPAAKNTLSDMINNASDMFIYGDIKSRRRDRERSGGSRVSYTSYYDRENRDRYYDRENRDRVYGRTRFNSEEIILPTRDSANDVVQNMFDILDQYNAVTVSDFLDLVGLPDEYVDRNFGWTSLRNAEVRRVRDGYVVGLPSPRVLP